MINSNVKLALIPAWVKAGINIPFVLIKNTFGFLNKFTYIIYKWRVERNDYRDRIKVINNRIRKMKLSKNFNLVEFTKSGTANKLGISNMPTKENNKNLRVLCEQVLQPLRDQFGPIRITSGFRNEELNKAVGGSEHSQHKSGQAVDIKPLKADLGEVFNYICHHMDIDQVILEKAGKAEWIHISYVGTKNRNMALLYVDGKYTRI